MQKLTMPKNQREHHTVTEAPLKPTLTRLGWVLGEI